MQIRKIVTTAMLSAGLAITVMGATQAQEPSAMLGIELNKLESNESGCLAYMLLNHQGEQALDSLVLDLYSFDADGIIGENLVIELAPVAAAKMTVKGVQFGAACENIARILVNSVPTCTSGGAAIDGCASSITLSSKAAAELAQ